jgi:hypothetical protein
MTHADNIQLSGKNLEEVFVEDSSKLPFGRHCGFLV